MRYAQAIMQKSFVRQGWFSFFYSFWKKINKISKEKTLKLKHIAEIFEDICILGYSVSFIDIFKYIVAKKVTL